ncbi:hypothetical protein BJY04DRAFT_219028 [Aspergillus karnatakaensis]|uniref:uncharacterized protein n=1 Tax=Aspergillus karnatakaensis TaxID=1810916 RepID=UPI003CCD4840
MDITRRSARDPPGPQRALSQNGPVPAISNHGSNTAIRGYDSAPNIWKASALGPSKCLINSLNKVLISNLHLIRNHGWYVLLRAVTHPTKTGIVKVIVSDESGDCVILHLHHQVDELSTHGHLSQGSVMVLKEPILTRGGGKSSDGTRDYLVITVVHLSDIALLSEYAASIPRLWRIDVPSREDTPSHWRSKGDILFQNGSYQLAIARYTRALTRSPSAAECQQIKYNRAIAHLRIGGFDAAILDLSSVFTDPRLRDRALAAKAQALYDHRRFEEASQVYHALWRQFPASTDARDNVCRAMIRLKETKMGEYVFKEMREKAEKIARVMEKQSQHEKGDQGPHPDRALTLDLDYATFVMAVTVRKTPDCGRGLFAVKEVKAGDLLLCEKAFVYVMGHSSTASHGLPASETTRPDSATNAGADALLQPALTSQVIQKLHKNPSQVPAITNLYSGPSEQSRACQRADGSLLVDSNHIQRIVSHNAFTRPLNSFYKQSAKAQTRPGETSDAVGSTYGPEPEPEPALDLDLDANTPRAIGLWPVASYTNHSCFPNAYISFIGDMLILRASRHIPADAEITIAYARPLESGDMVDFRHWGFECRCAVCEDWEGTGMAKIKKRKELIRDARTVLSRWTGGDCAEAEGDSDRSSGRGVAEEVQVQEASVQAPEDGRRNNTAASTAVPGAGVGTVPSAPTPLVSCPHVLPIFSALESTYRRPAVSFPRPAIWSLYKSYASTCITNRQMERAVDYILQAFGSLGFIIGGARLPPTPGSSLKVERWGMVVDELVGMWLMLGGIYERVAPGLASGAEAYARVTYRIVVGEDETFGDVYARG